MIVFVSTRAVYARVFCKTLSGFLDCDVDHSSIGRTLNESVRLIVIDGYDLHPQTLKRIMRENKSASFILITDRPYSSAVITEKLLGVASSDTSCRDIARLCQIAMGLKLGEDFALPNPQFSSIEEDMISALKHGASNKEISRKYKIPLSRVKYYLQKIYAQLGVNNRTQAALKAYKITL